MSASNPPPSTAPVPRSPALFVGRTSELRRVIESLQRVHLALVYGVGGAGKTAFALRAAESVVDHVKGTLVYHRCLPGESAATVVAALAASVGPDRVVDRATDPAQRLISLAAACPLVVCLDDAHHSRDPGLYELLVRVAAQRAAVFVLVTSREALPISPLEVDHVVCRLGAFGAEETRELWSALEHLYGPPAESARDAEDVLTRGTTPLVLKQAFAGQIDRDDHLQLGELPAASRRLLTRLCAFRRPMPIASLAEPDDAGARDAVRDLLRRFLVEPAGAGCVGLHDVVRDAIVRSPLAPTPDDHAFCLAYYESLPRRRPDTDQMERLWHAVGSMRDDLALGILAEHASDLGRYPPGSAVVERDLAAAIDTLATRMTLPPEVLLFRQRVLARQGQVEEAYWAARQFIDVVPAVEFDLADMAAALGRFDDAIVHATRAVRDRSLNPVMRAFAFAVLFDALRAKGTIEESAAILEEARRLVDELGLLGTLTWAAIQAMWMYDRQHYDDAAAHVATARRVISSIGIPFSMPLVASLERVLAVARGTTPECAPADLYDETAYFRCAARLLHVQELLFRGDMSRALELAETTIETATSHGFKPTIWWGTWQRARAAYCLGRAHEIRQQVEDKLREARDGGHVRAAAYLEVELARGLLLAGALDRATEVAETSSSAASDPVIAAPLEIVRTQAAYLAGLPPPTVNEAAFESCEGHDRASVRLGLCERNLWQGRLDLARAESSALVDQARNAGWSWIALRARVLGAEVLLREGQFGPAGIELRGLAEEAVERRYEHDALSIGLLEGALSRARGDLETARARFALVAARASALGLPIEHRAADIALAAMSSRPLPAESSPGGRLAHRLHLAEPLTLRVRERDAAYHVTERHRSELDVSRYRVGVDLVRGQFWVDTRWTDLSNRGALLGIIEALAASPNELVTVAQLVEAAWNVPYESSRHHSRVTTTMSRVRKLLGETIVRGTRDGYRLVFDAPWFVIDRLERAP